MIKDTDYFRNLDLASAATAIRKLGTERGQSEIFGDALTALFILSEERVVDSKEITNVVGLPDEIKKSENVEIWEYKWTDQHGPCEYTSSTPFLMVNGICKGLAQDNDDDD